MIGQTISHYRILEKIGQGGMGVVYKAYDTKLERHVALKFLPDHLMLDQSAKSRFLREAKRAAAINHKNVASVYQIVDEGGKTFIVMEYVEGKTIKELASEKLELDRVLETAIQISEGLDAAHRKDIVHRDIKSENIMVTKDNIVKIMDFGLAKLREDTGITSTGSTVGTLAYMSPEQTQGGRVDHRSDLFSLGIVLYELITGKLPFQGEHEAAITYSINYEEPEPIGRYRTGVPDELQRIITKLLKKNPDLRYQSSIDLLSDLKGLQKEWEPGDRKSSIVKRKMLAVLPFENLGSVEHEFFADGITDEITTRLARLSKLGVISRTSAIKYKSSNKKIRQIGSELGVDYVLEGTILWERSSETDRVRIRPRLIKVADDTLLWVESYDRVFDKIFDLLSDIAEKVANALQVMLFDSERREILTKLTENVVAYEYFLRGNDYLNRGYAEKELRMAEEMYGKAIEQDHNFASAHAKLSMVHSRLFWNFFDRAEERLRKAKAAVERALELNPDLAEAHLALGYYFYWGSREYDRAVEQFHRAETIQPNNSDLLAAIGYVQRRKGLFEEAVQNLTKAFTLDPLHAHLANDLAYTHHFMRNYQLAEKYYDHAISLSPDLHFPYNLKAWLYIMWEGKTEKSWKVLEVALGKVADSQLSYTRLWLEVFEGHYQKALELLSEPNKFIDMYGKSDVVSYFMTKALVHHFLNEQESKRTSYESALTILESRIQARPKDARLRRDLGIVYAGLGRREEAIMEGKMAAELLPISTDAWEGTWLLQDLALIHVMVGDYDAAIELVEYLLTIPAEFSISYLIIDPTWEPLRKQPGFQKLLTK